MTRTRHPAVSGGLLLAFITALLGSACAHDDPTPRNVHFASNKADPVAQDDYVTLGRALEAMQREPKLRLLLVGHTDGDGSDEHNRKLAFDRATRIRDLLLDEDPSLVHRLELAFFGKDRPIADNDTPEGKAKNRRVELYFYYPEFGTHNEVKLQREFGGSLEFQASASASVD